MCVWCLREIKLKFHKLRPDARLAVFTSRYAVPGSSIGDAVFEAGVVVVLAAGGALIVRHDRVVHGVGLRQRLEGHVVWTGTVLMSGT